ncbi:MAG: transcription antitermination factor NusB [Verrucomicrobiota bacterium]
MGKRRDGRRLVVQFLYQNDYVKLDDLERSLIEFKDLTNAAKTTWQFAEPLVRSILEKKLELDERIKSYSQNWDFSRMAAVDRNILRLALFEMFYMDDVPPIVAINEAIELAKNLSTEESGKFVNGILDRAKKDLDRPLR